MGEKVNRLVLKNRKLSVKKSFESWADEVVENVGNRIIAVVSSLPLQTVHYHRELMLLLALSVRL